MNTTTALNHSLDNLPTRPAVYNHRTMCAWLNARHDAALVVADNTLTVAATLNARGDVAAATDLIAEAREYFAEAARIRARVAA